MSLSYLNEKFGLAVRGMAVSPSSRHDRLKDAWLQLRTLKSEDVADPDLRLRFDRFNSRLTSHYEGNSENEDALAREVCDLSDAFSSLYFDEIEARTKR